MQQHMQQSTGQALAKKHTNTIYNGLTQGGTTSSGILNNNAPNQPKSYYQNINGQQA